MGSSTSRVRLPEPLTGAFPWSLIVVAVEYIVDRSAARGRRESEVVWLSWIGDEAKWTIQEGRRT